MGDDMIKVFLGKMVNCIMGYLQIVRFILLKKGYHAPFRQEPIEFMEYVQAFFREASTIKNFKHKSTSFLIK